MGNSSGDLPSVFDEATAAVPKFHKEVVLIGEGFGIGGENKEFKAVENF